MMPVRWLLALLLLLAAADVARAAPDQAANPPMPDPCMRAPNLPYCG